MTRTLLTCVLVGAVFAAVAAAQAGTGTVAAFKPTGTAGEYAVDTGVIAGVFRQGGRSEGFFPLAHVSTGTPVADPPGLFNYYRIFTTNRRHGESMRGIASETELLENGGLRVRWPASDELPFELTGVYVWRTPTTLDLETTVKVTADLPDFEVFLSSYCGEKFPSTFVYVNRPGGQEKEFMTAKEEYGLWQAYPRDEQGERMIRDGRWTYPPSPVEWAIMPTLAGPLAFRRAPDTGLVIAVMAPPEDCFAVLTPREKEGHYSLYLSLFGRTLRAGETAVAHSRLLVGAQLTDEQVIEQYQSYIEELSQRGQQ